MSPKTLLILCPYPAGEAPSQRFRFEQYLDALRADGWQVRQEPFWSAEAWQILYREGRVGAKMRFMVKAMARRHRLLLGCREQIVFIHREFSPIGLPLMVWMLKHVWKKKLVFDFDDAIWIPNSSESNRWIAWLKAYGNIRRIIRMADAVFCGNAFLQSYALKYQKNTHLIPTTIDTEGHHNRLAEPPKDRFVVGWTGSHSTLHYLEMLWPVLDAVHAKKAITFVVISDRAPSVVRPYLRFVPWSKETEIEGLLSCHIGLMPLLPDPWSEGKCGFKALQYLALGVPALVSPVGVNTEIVQNGFNGFVCSTESDWLSKLWYCIEHPEGLDAMRQVCRPDLETRYSVKAFRPVYSRILNQMLIET